MVEWISKTSIFLFPSGKQYLSVFIKMSMIVFELKKRKENGPVVRPTRSTLCGRTINLHFVLFSFISSPPLPSCFNKDVDRDAHSESARSAGPFFFVPGRRLQVSRIYGRRAHGSDLARPRNGSSQLKRRVYRAHSWLSCPKFHHRSQPRLLFIKLLPTSENASASVLYGKFTLSLGSVCFIRCVLVPLSNR